MITNVLNQSSYYFETWNTLRFAAKAKSIKISPKANFDTEGSEEGLKQEISHLLRKIDMLEKNQGGTVQGAQVNNQQVIKLVDRLENAWDGVINDIEERQLLFKEAISKSDEYFINLIMEFRQCLVGRGSEILLKTKFMPILEELEQFFGQNWSGVGPREVIDKLDCFHEIVKDEIRALKGVVQSQPQRARDKLKRIKKRWQHSLERIDEIMSDEEEEKEIINGLLSCMDETTASPDNPQENQDSNEDTTQDEKRFTWGAPEGQNVERVSKDSIKPHKDQKSNLMIDLSEINKQQNNDRSGVKDSNDLDHTTNNNRTGRLSSARTKDVKMAEVQELLSQFTPQKIRMVMKENDLLNKKIQKQRFLILEMKKKMDEVEEQRATKTHRLNRSCDDVPASLLGNLERVVDESVAPWNENELRQFDSVYDDRKSVHFRRSTFKSREPQYNVPLPAQSLEVLLEEDIKINSPRNEMAESIRELLFNDEQPENPNKGAVFGKKPAFTIEAKKKEELMNDLFDPSKRFQPKSHREWRDTAYGRDSAFPDLNGKPDGTFNPSEYTSPYDERPSEGVLVGSPVKDPFKEDDEVEVFIPSEKFRNQNESPGIFKRENQILKSDLETLSKKFKDLEEQKVKWEKRFANQEGFKESRISFLKQKPEAETELVASEKLTGELIQTTQQNPSLKPRPQHSKISLFTQNKPEYSELRSNKTQESEQKRSQNLKEEHISIPETSDFTLDKQSFYNRDDDTPYQTISMAKKSAFSPSQKSKKTSKYPDDTPPRIITDFMPEDSMRKSNQDEELKVMEIILQEKSKEALSYLKLIEKLQKENDQLRETSDASSSLGLYKLKLENKKLKEAIRKIAGKVKQEIALDTD